MSVTMFRKVVGLMAAVVVLGACASDANEGATPQPAASSPDQTGAIANSDPIRVGYIGALTGGSAPMGLPARNGILLAFEEANAAGGINGRPIELVSFDDEADASRSVAGAQGFVRDKNISLVLGGPNSPTVLANREVLAEAGLPLLIAVAQEDALVDSASPTFASTFRLTEPNRVNIGVMVEYVKSQGCSRVDVIADDSAYGQGGATTIRNLLLEAEVQVGQIVSHAPSADNMTAEVLSVKNGGADCVYVFSLGSPAALFFQAADAQGLDIPAFGGRGLNMSSFLDLLAGVDANVIAPSVANPGKPEFDQFTESYAARFGPERWYMFPVLGYDAGRLAVEALRLSDGESGQALVAAFESIKNFPIVGGRAGATASFGPDDHEAGEDTWNVLVAVRQGELVVVDLR